MREIKFRAWSKYKNLMGEVTGFRFSKSQYPFVNVRFKENGKIVDEGYHFGQEDGCDSVILMQFTGLYDKNGKEIYEGDIVNLAHKDTHPYMRRKPLVIRWVKKSAVFVAGDTIAMENVLEVIGNIYENPELLKENG